MDTVNSTFCTSSKVIYAAGHFSSYMNYGSGKFEI